MIVVITGTHKGLGKKIAEHFLGLDAIVLGCSRHDSTIEHDNYHHFLADVQDEDQMTSFAKKVRQEFGHIDVLINNAGVASMNHFLMTPLDTAKRLMNVNYFGSLLSVRSFVNLLKKSEHPRVVSFSSVAVPLALDGELTYAASKAAIESMTRIMAKELSTFKITVNAVGPSPIQTDLIAKVPQEKIDRILNSQAIHRFGEADDVINVIDFFVNPKSDFITGQVIYLGGVSK